MSWNIKTPGDYINGPLTVAGAASFQSNLAVGLASATSRLHVVGGSFQNPLILDTTGYNHVIFRLNGSDRGQITADGTNCFAVINSANSAYRMLVKDAGNVGFGVDPTQPLHVYRNQSATTFVAVENQQNNAASGAGLYLAAYGGTWDVSALHSATFVNPLVFRFNNAEKGRLTPAGAFILNGGATGANGVGIAFPAAQSASTDANTLDDYEEGTFTPAIAGSTTAGTATYVGRSGKYTKIGNQIQVQIYIDYNSHTGTGDTRITGLPFNASSNFSGATVGYANAITISSGYYLAAYVDSGNPWILLNQVPTAGGTNQTVPIDPAGTLVISATYTV